MESASTIKLRPILGLIALVLTAACQGSTRGPVAAPSNPNPNNISGGGGAPVPPRPPEADSLCSRADTQMALDRGLDSNAVNFAMANGYYGWCIPEFDDDQRLSDANGGNDYGAVAHVLAAPWLDTLQFTTGRFEQVAIVEVDADPKPPAVPYTDLHLQRFNCLYLKQTGSAPSFDAAIAPPTGLKCPSEPAPGSNGGPPLVVAVDEAFSNQITDYPATTRFIEGHNNRTLIGVRCGARWCAVGPESAMEPPAIGFTGRLAPSAHNGRPGFDNAQARVKGWFDDQVLGIPDGDLKYQIHRQVRASAVPNWNLGSLTLDKFIGGVGVEHYQPVGRVYFPVAPDTGSKYVKIFGFSQGTNDVAMRAEILPDPVPGKMDTVWYTQVVNARGERTNDIKTRRMDHRRFLHAVFGEKFRIPGTMRWRWSDDDEDLWVECDVGCCLAGIH